jgi:Cu(I)/Ag(I) efflux system membrane fusion protein
MRKTKWIIILIVLIGAIFFISKNSHKLNDSGTPNGTEKPDENIYYTCPMHPQIHSEHPGECPICHMKLVQVKAQPKEGAAKESEEKRSDVQATSLQLEAIGVQKAEVEKMTLIATLPVSGRIISSTSVAFQAYEQDVRYLRLGLNFKGTGSIYPEDEIRGVIASVDSIVDPSSRTVRVLGQIQERSRSLIPETSFRGEVEIKLPDRIAIPESSVLHTGQGDLVYVVDKNDKLSPRKIKVGLKTSSYYEVLAGLSVGETISSGPNFLIDSEAKIRGASASMAQESTSNLPSCPEDQYWDIPMSMCMPGKSK